MKKLKILNQTINLINMMKSIANLNPKIKMKNKEFYKRHAKVKRKLHYKTNK